MTCEGGGSLEIYLEPVLPKPELLIVGRSPVAQIVSELGKLLDFKVCLADPRSKQGTVFRCRSDPDRPQHGPQSHQ